jgi:DnaJ-class molecular chaperone
MDFQTAIKTLELNAGFSLVDVKRNYYKLSLKWHPDKNTSINSTKKFQEIAEAYEFLKIYLDLENGNETNETNESNENDFLNMCNHFLSSLIETTKTMTGNRITNEQIMNILKQLTTKCEKVSIKLFEGIDKESSILLFNYLVSYADILSISQETLNEIKNVIELKMKNDNIIILNPNIENLLNDEVYVLTFEDKTYYIPLWHNELIYDTTKGKLIVKIEPELPPHLEIDDNNNIIVNLTTKINSLLVNEKLIFKLGEKVFQMTSENLRIKKKQQFFLKNKGLTRINYSELYNIKKKADIIVNLELVE